MTQNTQIIPPRVPFVDPQTGLIAREWYRFLANIFDRVGGGESATTITEVSTSVTTLEAATDVALAFLPSSYTVATAADPAIQNDVICYMIFGG